MQGNKDLQQELRAADQEAKRANKNRVSLRLVGDARRLHLAGARPRLQNQNPCYNGQLRPAGTRKSMLTASVRVPEPPPESCRSARTRITILRTHRRRGWRRSTGVSCTAQPRCQSMNRCQFWAFRLECMMTGAALDEMLCRRCEGPHCEGLKGPHCVTAALPDCVLACLW